MRPDDFRRWRDHMLAVTRQNAPQAPAAPWPGVLVTEGPLGSGIMPTAMLAQDARLWRHARERLLPAYIVEVKATAYCHVANIYLSTNPESIRRGTTEGDPERFESIMVQLGALPDHFEIWHAKVGRSADAAPTLGGWTSITEATGPSIDPLQAALLAGGGAG